MGKLKPVRALVLTFLFGSISCAPFQFGNRKPENGSALETTKQSDHEDISTPSGDNSVVFPEYKSPFTQNLTSSNGQKREPPLLSWPVPPSSKLSQEFKPRALRKHFGIDITNKTGTKIFAAHDGWIIYSGAGFSGYGKVVVIDSGNGWSSLYAHCQKLLVKEGQRIYRGQTIATMGATGNAEATHLHFELLKNKIPVDPLEFLP